MTGPLVFTPGGAYDYQTSAQVAASIAASQAAQDVVTNAAFSSLWDTGQVRLTVKDYGAVGNGVADDTTAIQNTINGAVSSGKFEVYFPAGIYKVSGTLTINSPNVSITGAGRSATTITSNSASLPIFSITSGHTYITIRSMSLTRSVAATAGGNGITATGVYESIFIHDMWIEKQYNGLALGSVPSSKIRDICVSKCLSSGIVFQTTTGVNAMQWNVEDILVVQCAEHGFVVVPGGTQTSINLGEWINVQTYGNSGHGIVLSGSAPCPINGLRINGGFLGEDGNSELMLNTYGGLHEVRNLFTELAGRNPTGPVLATPATHVGNGVEVTVNNYDVHLVSIRADGNSYNGIQSSATDILINACRCSSNGHAAVAGSRNGISIPAGRAMIHGCSCGGGGQLYGVFLTNGAGNGLVGNDLSDNVTLPLTVSATATQLTSVGNIPIAATLHTILPSGGMQVGITAAGPSIPGGINAQGAIALNGTNYTNP